MKKTRRFLLLFISRRTLDYYLKRGYLDRVYGGGCVNSIGVSRESFLRFQRLRVRHPAPHPYRKHTEI